MNKQRLYRSRTNRVFAGVCGGLAEYFDVDPVVIRVIFILFVLFGGTGILLYIAAIFIVPQKPFVFTPESEPSAAKPVDRIGAGSSVRNWLGYALVGGGVFLLLANLDVFHLFDFFDDAFEYVFPVLLIIVGMAIIYYRQTANERSSAEATSEDQTCRTTGQLRRSSTDKKLFGVCGGLAQYFGLDSSIIRLLYIVLCLASFGAGIVLYLVLALIVPDDKLMNVRTNG